MQNRQEQKFPLCEAENTSNDYATTADVLKEVLKRYSELGMTYENVCCIYPTAPFVTGKKLQTALDILMKEKRDSVMPVTSFSFPPLRGMVIKDWNFKLQMGAICNDAFTGPGRNIS